VDKTLTLVLVIGGALVLFLLFVLSHPPLVTRSPVTIEGADGTFAERALQPSPELEMSASGAAQPVLIQDAPGIWASDLTRSQVILDTTSDLRAMILVEDSPTIHSGDLDKSTELWEATSTAVPMILIEHGSGTLSAPLDEGIELTNSALITPSIVIEHAAGVIAMELACYPDIGGSSSSVTSAILIEHAEHVTNALLTGPIMSREGEVGR